MTDLSKGREGTLLGKGLTMGGRIKTATGVAVEEIADKENKSPSTTSTGAHFIDANKKVGKAAAGSIGDK